MFYGGRQMQVSSPSGMSAINITTRKSDGLVCGVLLEREIDVDTPYDNWPRE